MNTENYYLEPNFSTGRVRLAVREYIPHNLKSILIVLHGMTEHMGRYEELATGLCDVGIGVVGFDLPGHGCSTSFGGAASFGENNWDCLVDYISKFVHLVKEKYNCPLYIMGFSLGSFLLREYLCDNPTNLNGAIIVGTGVQPNIILRAMECIVSKEAEKVGFNNGSSFIDNLSFGQYNKEVTNASTPYDWLCSDANAIADYAIDDLCKKQISAGLFLQLLQSMRKTNNPKQYRTWNHKLPILILSGTDDPVGGKGRGPQSVCDQLVAQGVSNTKMELLPGRHDIFHEHDNDTARKVIDFIVDFING